MAKSRSTAGTVALIGLGALAVAATVAAYKYRKEIREYVENWDTIKLRRVSDPDENDIFTADLDGDGNPDTVLADTDGNGTLDTAFVDTDGDGKVDVVLADIDDDGEMETIISGDAGEPEDA